MSRVYFHSQSLDDVEVRGSERAYAGNLTGNLALAALGADGYRMRERLEPMLPADSYLRNALQRGASDGQWAKTFETWWRVNMDDDMLTVGDLSLAPWNLTLNTALVAGSDAIEWLARMHATCEIHGYVEGPHRSWLADIIEVGCGDRLLRRGADWEAVIELLNARDDEPVVMSYSVCESFPNSDVADYMPPWPNGVPKRWDALTEPQQAERETLSDAWYDLPKAEQWERGLRGLRTGEGSIDLHPDMWGVRGFGDPAWSVFDLLDHLDNLPVEAVH